MKYCALCCMAKDEDPFIKEWIAYHALLGFEHFIIYDDVSTVPIRTLLDGWIAPHRISILRHSEHRSQYDVYTHCLESFGDSFQWIAFLDMDEFIRLAPAQSDTTPDIRAFLTEFEPYAGLGINWRSFSWNGLEKTPDGPCIAHYTQCLGDDKHIKSIVQPAKVAHPSTPHSFYTLPGEYVVDAAHKAIPQGLPFAVPCTNRIAINHYYYKSRECFSKKIQRGNPVHITRRMEQFDQHIGLKTHADTALRPFFGAVATAMQAAQLPEDFFARCWQETAPVDTVITALGAEVQALRTVDAATRDALLVRTAHCAMRCYEATRQATPDACALTGAPANPTVALAQLWLLRAQITLKGKDTTLAQHCLEQSFKLAQTLEGLQLLAEVYRQENDLTALRAVMDILHACLAGQR